MISLQSASFMRNANGEVCIAFDDAAFARAEIVFIDPNSLEVTALLDGVQLHIGHISPDLAHSFMSHETVLLTGPHPMGYDVTLEAALMTLH